MSPDGLVGQDVWVLAKGYRPDVGGMQTYAEMVAQAYRGAGARVTVFTQTSSGPRRVVLDDVTLIDIGPGTGLSIARRLRAALRRELAAHGPPLLIHGTTWRTSVIPLSLGLRYVTTFHGREFMRIGPLERGVMVLVARRADAIVAVSRYSADRLQEVLGERFQPIVAWNGISPAIDSSAHAEGLPGPVRIFTLCRLEPRKNVLACLDALAILEEEGADFSYRIAGTGPELEILRQRIFDLELSDRVELLGFVNGKTASRLYREATIFLHPHITIDDGRDFEGFGIAIADAMAAETVVVVGQAGGAAELVEHGVSGILVDGENLVDLTSAIRELVRDPERCALLAHSARSRAQEWFSWEEHIKRILEALPPSMQRRPHDNARTSASRTI